MDVLLRPLAQNSTAPCRRICSSSAFLLCMNSLTLSTLCPSLLSFTNSTPSVHHSVMWLSASCAPSSWSLSTLPPILQCATTVFVSLEKCTALPPCPSSCGTTWKSLNISNTTCACSRKGWIERVGRFNSAGREVCVKSRVAFVVSAWGRRVE